MTYMYKIKWEIELEASTPIESVKEALDSIVNGTATIFTVQNMNTEECFSVDLDADDDLMVLPLSLKDFNS